MNSNDKNYLVIVRLSGGIGNQLFQYALARSLSVRNNIEIKIDSGFLKSKQSGVTQREFLLNNFNISLDEASNKDFKKNGIPDFNDLSLWGKFKIKLFNLFSKDNSDKKIVIDKGFIFDKKILDIKENKYLMGNWTSPKYFDDIRDVLLKEITLKETSFKFEDFVKKIISCNSVSVHIRRGDFLLYPKLGVCSVDYYNKSIALIKQKIESPTFFVFSDDIKYVEENINFGENKVFISKEGLKDYEELILMSKCKNNIMANSSFSWWGSWLNQNPDKIVIAPLKLREDGKDTSDYIPEEFGWIRI